MSRYNLSEIFINKTLEIVNNYYLNNNIKLFDDSLTIIFNDDDDDDKNDNKKGQKKGKEKGIKNEIKKANPFKNIKNEENEEELIKKIKNIIEKFLYLISITKTTTTTKIENPDTFFIISKHFLKFIEIGNSIFCHDNDDTEEPTFIFAHAAHQRDQPENDGKIPIIKMLKKKKIRNIIDNLDVNDIKSQNNSFKLTFKNSDNLNDNLDSNYDNFEKTFLLESHISVDDLQFSLLIYLLVIIYKDEKRDIIGDISNESCFFCQGTNINEKNNYSTSNILFLKKKWIDSTKSLFDHNSQKNFFKNISYFFDDDNSDKKAHILHILDEFSSFYDQNLFKNLEGEKKKSIFNIGKNNGIIDNKTLFKQNIKDFLLIKYMNYNGRGFRIFNYSLKYALNINSAIHDQFRYRKPLCYPFTNTMKNTFIYILHHVAFFNRNVFKKCCVFLLSEIKLKKNLGFFNEEFNEIFPFVFSKLYNKISNIIDVSLQLCISHYIFRKNHGFKNINDLKNFVDNVTLSIFPVNQSSLLNNYSSYNFVASKKYFVMLNRNLDSNITLFNKLRSSEDFLKKEKYIRVLNYSGLYGNFGIPSEYIYILRGLFFNNSNTKITDYLYSYYFNFEFSDVEISKFSNFCHPLYNNIFSLRYNYGLPLKDPDNEKIDNIFWIDDKNNNTIYSVNLKKYTNRDIQEEISKMEIFIKMIFSNINHTSGPLQDCSNLKFSIKLNKYDNNLNIHRIFCLNNEKTNVTKINIPIFNMFIFYFDNDKTKKLSLKKKNFIENALLMDENILNHGSNYPGIITFFRILNIINEDVSENSYNKTPFDDKSTDPYNKIIFDDLKNLTGDFLKNLGISDEDCITQYKNVTKELTFQNILLLNNSMLFEFVPSEVSDFYYLISSFIQIYNKSSISRYKSVFDDVINSSLKLIDRYNEFFNERGKGPFQLNFFKTISGVVKNRKFLECFNLFEKTSLVNIISKEDYRKKGTQKRTFISIPNKPGMFSKIDNDNLEIDDHKISDLAKEMDQKKIYKIDEKFVFKDNFFGNLTNSISKLKKILDNDKKYSGDFNLDGFLSIKKKKIIYNLNGNNIKEFTSENFYGGYDKYELQDISYGKKDTTAKIKKLSENSIFKIDKESFIS